MLSKLQHLAHLEEVFKRLHEVNMKIHPKKCEFVVTSVVYFGHKILPNGIMAHWAKVVAILEMPNPTHVRTLRSFIRLCNYYKIYVQEAYMSTRPSNTKQLFCARTLHSVTKCLGIGNSVELDLN